MDNTMDNSLLNGSSASALNMSTSDAAAAAVVAATRSRRASLGESRASIAESRASIGESRASIAESRVSLNESRARIAALRAAMDPSDGSNAAEGAGDPSSTVETLALPGGGRAVRVQLSAQPELSSPVDPRLLAVRNLPDHGDLAYDRTIDIDGEVRTQR